MNSEAHGSLGIITEAARSLIGSETPLPGFEISRGELSRFVAAAQETDPRYQLDAVNPRVPPIFYMAAIRPFLARDEVAYDGGLASRRLPMGDGRVMAGGYDIEFLAPVYVGDALEGVRRLENLTEKSGSQRDFAIADWTTRVVNQRHELVVIEKWRQLYFGVQESTRPNSTTQGD